MDSIGSAGGASGCQGCGALIRGGGAADCGASVEGRGGSLEGRGGSVEGRGGSFEGRGSSVDCNPADHGTTEGGSGAIGGCIGNVVGCFASVGATAAMSASPPAAGAAGGALAGVLDREGASLGLGFWSAGFSKNWVFPGPICRELLGGCRTVTGGSGSWRWSGLGGRGGEAPAGGARLASRVTIKLASPKRSSVEGVTACHVFPIGEPFRYTGAVAGSTAAAKTCSPSNIRTT